jgi:hemolysin activation/secretion protein
LGVTYAFDPKSNFYYNADYVRPIVTPDWHVGIGASRNAYDLGADLEALGVSGVTEQAYIRLNRLFFQSFRERLSAELRFSRQNAETTAKGVQLSDDKLAPLDLGLDYLMTDVLLAPEGRANQTRLIGDYTHGFGNILGAMDAVDAPDSSRVGKDGQHAGAQFDKLVGGVIRKQAAFWGTDLWLRANGQWTNDFLVPLEQFAVGGPNSVRAYPTAEYLFDKGYFASLEWEFGVPFLKKWEGTKPNCFYVPNWTSRNAPTKVSEALKLSIFADFAEGWLNNAVDPRFEHQAVTGIGVGVKFEARNLRWNMSLATPVGSPAPSNDHDPQFFFSIAYQPF